MRRYLDTHPWITFRATDLNDLEPRMWMLLGEAGSKCEHLAGTPLRPDVAERLYKLALIKGAQATTAIEGNTLTEEQVAGIHDGTYSAPPSRAYQEREVRNVLEALQEIADHVMGDDSPTITKDLICEFNRRLLGGTEHEPDAVAGQSPGPRSRRGQLPGRPCGGLRVPARTPCRLARERHLQFRQP